MQIEGTKLIFMYVSVLHVFKFASRMPQIAQILVSTFKIFQGVGGGIPLNPPPPPPPPLRNFLFFSLAVPGSVLYIQYLKEEPLISFRISRSSYTAWSGIEFPVFAI